MSARYKANAISIIQFVIYVTVVMLVLLLDNGNRTMIYKKSLSVSQDGSVRTTSSYCKCNVTESARKTNGKIQKFKMKKNEISSIP